MLIDILTIKKIIYETLTHFILSQVGTVAVTNHYWQLKRTKLNVVKVKENQSKKTST